MSHRSDALDLIERVAEQDPDAAEYLLTEYRLVPTGALSAGRPNQDYTLANNLDSTFLWTNTPQGGTYWSNLHSATRGTG